MRVTFTRHAKRKKEIIENLGWSIRLSLVENTIRNPDFESKTKTGQQTAVSFVDEKHILMIVYEIRNGIIVVITFHISRKGRYGT